ncbi:MAG: GTPase Era [Bacteroidia bacterium]|nr:GTPase Era [Bacteroidia bacterium]MCZ2277270.1 GTPase Era [Bacteroidia bacterium]
MSFKAGFVAITGKPNAGKSTLMNRILGKSLSAVTPKVQTTRHRIKGILNSDDYQIVFSDTPGILEPAYELHKKMLEAIEQSMQDADVILLVDDVSSPHSEESVFQQIGKLSLPLIIALNKADLADTQKLETRINLFKKIFPHAELIPISATSDFNLDTLVKVLLKYLPEGQPYYSTEELSDRNERFFAEEIIREQIFLNYQKEIPYSCEVVVDQWQEFASLIKIYSIIFVMRESQKRIILGNKGIAIRKMATIARKKLERFTGKKVFLDITIKVKEGWRNDEKSLKRLGYRNE